MERDGKPQPRNQTITPSETVTISGNSAAMVLWWSLRRAREGVADASQLMPHSTCSRTQNQHIIADYHSW
jgi:hypothetical protein